MTPKERETLKKLLQKEKEEKQKIRKLEVYRQAKNLEENINGNFQAICNFLGLENDDEKDQLLNYLLSEKFKDYFLNRELKNDPFFG